MASDRPVKCPYCSGYFRRSAEKYIYEKSRYWHEECYNLQLSEKERKEKDKKSLMTYIEKLLNKKIDAKILSQIKKYVEEYGYKYKGIELTLHYFYEIKGNSTAKAQGGIGIVPYVYEEAKNYHMMKSQVTNALETLEVAPVIEKKVTIKDPTKHKKHLTKRTIDITGL